MNNKLRPLLSTFLCAAAFTGCAPTEAVEVSVQTRERFVEAVDVYVALEHRYEGVTTMKKVRRACPDDSGTLAEFTLDIAPLEPMETYVTFAWVSPTESKLCDGFNGEDVDPLFDDVSDLAHAHADAAPVLFDGGAAGASALALYPTPKLQASVIAREEPKKGLLAPGPRAFVETTVVAGDALSTAIANGREEDLVRKERDAL